MSIYGVFCDPYFPVFELNTEIYNRLTQYLTDDDKDLVSENESESGQEQTCL